MKARAVKTLRPKTKMGRMTLWTAGLTLFIVILHLIEGLPLRSLMSGWADFYFIVFLFCAWWVSCRWVWRKMMWRLRYRLLVTYVFMGFIPIALLLLLVGVAGYLFAGQFAGYVAISNLQSASLHLGAENDVLASHLSALDRSGKLDSHTAGKLAAGLGGEFSQRTVTVWQGKDGYMIAADGTPLKTPPAKVPDSIKGAFSGVVVERDTLFLRAVRFYYENGGRLAVVSSVPITPRLLRSATSSLGLVTLFPPGLGNNVQIPPPPNADGAENNIVRAGAVPPETNQFDVSFRFYTVFNAIDWEKGESEDVALGVVTRPSALYNTLFASVGDKALILEYGLLVIVILLGLVELVAKAMRPP
jgi:sigma-B regulation protein RsbU (phosphoserine phosphatase)